MEEQCLVAFTDFQMIGNYGRQNPDRLCSKTSLVVGGGAYKADLRIVIQNELSPCNGFYRVISAEIAFWGKSSWASHADTGFLFVSPPPGISRALLPQSLEDHPHLDSFLVTTGRQHVYPYGVGFFPPKSRIDTI